MVADMLQRTETGKDIDTNSDQSDSSVDTTDLDGSGVDQKTNSPKKVEYSLMAKLRNFAKNHPFITSISVTTIMLHFFYLAYSNNIFHGTHSLTSPF